LWREGIERTATKPTSPNSTRHVMMPADVATHKNTHSQGDEGTTGNYLPAPRSRGKSYFRPTTVEALLAEISKSIRFVIFLISYLC